MHIPSKMQSDRIKLDAMNKYDYSKNEEEEKNDLISHIKIGRKWVHVVFVHGHSLCTSPGSNE